MARRPVIRIVSVKPDKLPRLKNWLHDERNLLTAERAEPKYDAFEDINAGPLTNDDLLSYIKSKVDYTRRHSTLPEKVIVICDNPEAIKIIKPILRNDERYRQVPYEFIPIDEAGNCKADQLVIVID